MAISYHTLFMVTIWNSLQMAETSRNCGVRPKTLNWMKALARRTQTNDAQMYLAQRYATNNAAPLCVVDSRLIAQPFSKLAV
jgi:hypothetical protein